MTWHFGEVAAFEDGDPDETERELYRLGFARPPHSLPWLVATIVCPLLIPGEVVQVIAGDVPSTTDTTPYAEQALESAVRAELEAQTAALAELRKLAEMNAKGTPQRDKTVLFDGEFRPSAEWRDLAAKATR